ncbi:MAG: RNA-guided endonuclease IscB [Limnospira sp. PMC 1291.21]|uniref:RNA-guided endonuclease IscB n=1 Tax=unclassified Limnospira TaxID=2642885 RepID=UPI0028E169C9|nr:MULTISPECIES: RNA-guided endonuclease IscB [unclassified Limnospira]MDT9196153.1 RNA-guided endonuclease IscB [Limnospira sp. PMC 1245.20]MDT9206415.1 RNA-guided endonuclease IscB [Limnospira sp. PMC 1243.20]MDT9211549.1 RNA-guided endonuclease IscB [Limnospira sp. PMC 1252.20]MDT9216639.1 RNA-guided endonuclease IscB [Limnospira sp. PMC 1256.20]MDT9221768.1 RNA-guided endonuclease IscB [Limnospira sp. PMC 1240.20]
MSNHIFVLDTNRKPLTPCKPGVARSLLKAGKASVFRRYPFTIILNKEVDANPEPLELKLDPGSKVTGIALKQGNHIIFAAELQHRGQQIKEALLSRRQLRRSRRNRKTRYRPARFLNRTRPEGWLAPSWQHRVDTLMTWVHRFRRLAPVGRITQELVRFDLQLMENPEISGVEYQQGELQGYEVREYLLDKWGRTCAYCGAQNVPLEVEQIQPRSKGGSDRVSNLTMACHSCNQAKGNGDIRDFLSGQPDVLSRLLRQAKSPLKDAAAVNSTRWALFKALKATGLPVTTGTGGQTKFNRLRLNLPKAHWLDAACVGPVESLEVLTSKPLLILAKGHGTRQMCGTNKYGFPNRHRSRRQIHKGFQTGDMVTALVTAGKKIGSYLGRVLCRASGSFDITTASVRVAGISHKYCQPIHRKDGYAYA